MIRDKNSEIPKDLMMTLGFLRIKESLHLTFQIGPGCTAIKFDKLARLECLDEKQFRCVVITFSWLNCKSNSNMRTFNTFKH